MANEEIPATLKPLKVKPQFYSVCLEPMQQIARDMGYNLIIHGSVNRDMDLVAIAWTDNPKPRIELIHAFCDFLGVEKFTNPDAYLYTKLPGGRDSYVINLNRGSKHNNYQDAQYYLDISFTPLPSKHIP
jgi:hypothetical protein